MTDPQHSPIIVQATGTALVTAVMTVMSFTLLVSGTAIGHMPLLAWGVVTGVIAVAMASLIATRVMIQNAMDRSVERTAVKVGDAIAEALGDERPVTPPVGVTTLYS